MIKTTTALASTALLLSAAPLWACPTCRPLVKSGVYNADFGSNLLVLLLPIAILAAIAGGLYFSDAIAAKLRRASSSEGGEQWQAPHSAGR